MAGILDFLQNPKVQDTALSVAGAAAFGINPILGLLAAPMVMDHRSKTRLENDISREAVTAAKRTNRRGEEQDAAIANLPAILAGGAPLTPSGREAELTRTASVLNPQAMGTALAQQIFPNQNRRQTPAERIADFEAKVGRGATEEEIIAAYKMGGETPSATDQLLLEEARLRLQERLGNMQDEKDEKAEEELREVDATRAVMGNLEAMEESLQVLEGSFLEPGSTGSKFFRDYLATPAEWAADLLGEGKTAEDIRTQRVAYDTFRKNSQDLVANTLSRMQAEGMSVTVSLQRLVENASANENMSIGSIRSINAITAQEVLTKDERQPFLTSEERISLRRVARKFKADGFNFATEAEAQAAFDAKLIDVGDEITVNGVVGDWK